MTKRRSVETGAERLLNPVAPRLVSPLAGLSVPLHSYPGAAPPRRSAPGWLFGPLRGGVEGSDSPRPSPKALTTCHPPWARKATMGPGRQAEPTHRPIGGSARYRTSYAYRAVSPASRCRIFVIISRLTWRRVGLQNNSRPLKSAGSKRCSTPNFAAWL